MWSALSSFRLSRDASASCLPDGGQTQTQSNHSVKILPRSGVSAFSLCSLYHSLHWVLKAVAPSAYCADFADSTSKQTQLEEGWDPPETFSGERALPQSASLCHNPSTTSAPATTSDSHLHRGASAVSLTPPQLLSVTSCPVLSPPPMPPPRGRRAVCCSYCPLPLGGTLPPRSGHVEGC